MKRIKPLLVALALSLATIIGGAIVLHGYLDCKNPEFGKYSSRNKFQNPDLMGRNMTDNTLLLLGSSELHHQLNSKFHCGSVFNGSDLTVMGCGDAFYQSIVQAITVGSMDSYMKKRQVTLIVSPQWFFKKGINPAAFSKIFSELHYKRFLENPNISATTRKQIVKRAHTLLTVDPASLCAAKEIERVVSAQNTKDATADAMDVLDMNFRQAFFQEKYNLAAALNIRQKGIADAPKPTAPANYNWTALEKKADKSGKKAVGNTPFMMRKKSYDKRIKPVVEEMQDAFANESLVESPEYNDLTLFLDVCKDCDIKVQLIMVPMNGSWYDHTGLTKSTRQNLYSKVAGIAKEYGATYADLSRYEYTKYFMEDASHIGWKGWIEVDKAIHSFVTENQSK